MKLSPISFQARLKRQSDYSGKSATKKQWLDTYDKSIKAIQKQKERAIELDTFMRSDEVKEKLRQLPTNTTVEMVSNLWVSDGEVANGRGLEIDSLSLDYDGADKIKYLRSPKNLEALQQGRLCIAQTKDGKINKEGILSWLDKMIDLSWHSYK